MATALDITPKEMAVYRASARRQQSKRRQELIARRTRARKTASRAAALLKEQYGVRRVMLFGSLARNEPFSFQSDIDLVVWGLDNRVYYRVVSQLLDLDPSIAIDLILAEDASDSLLEAIKKEGTPL